MLYVVSCASSHCNSHWPARTPSARAFFSARSQTHSAASRDPKHDQHRSPPCRRRAAVAGGFLVVGWHHSPDGRMRTFGALVLRRFFRAAWKPDRGSTPQREGFSTSAATAIRPLVTHAAASAQASAHLQISLLPLLEEAHQVALEQTLGLLSYRGGSLFCLAIPVSTQRSAGPPPGPALFFFSPRCRCYLTPDHQLRSFARAWLAHAMPLSDEWNAPQSWLGWQSAPLGDRKCPATRCANRAVIARFLDMCCLA